MAFRQDMLAPIACESPIKSLAAKGFSLLPLRGTGSWLRSYSRPCSTSAIRLLGHGDVRLGCVKHCKTELASAGIRRKQKAGVASHSRSWAFPHKLPQKGYCTAL